MSSEREAFEVEEVVEPPERFSMSFIRAAGACLRRAHYERRASVGSDPATIGRIFHEIAATVGFAVVMRGEAMVDPGEAMVVADRVMRNPEDADPLSDVVFGEVRNLVGRWARTATFRDGEQFEIGSRIELNGRTLSARIDRLAISEEGGATIAEARDYKTGWGDPSKRLTPQGKNYAWHILKANPGVDVVRYCEDHIRFSAPPLVFEITRDELSDIEAWLATSVARIEALYAAGNELETSPGEACTAFGRACPVAASCPVPEWARRGASIETEAEALSELEALFVEEARIAGRKQAIRGYLEDSGKSYLTVGDREIGWAAKGGSSFDQKAALAALEEASGEPVDKADFMLPTNPSFGLRKARS